MQLKDKDGKPITGAVLFVVGTMVLLFFAVIIALGIAIIAALLKWAF